MANYNNITARWDRGTLSETIISRQFDDAATLVAFAGVPTGDDDEDAVYHLIVWMATEEGGEPHEQAPILLDAPEWLISNFYTQFTQVIRFQLCIQTEGGAYEAHSPIFSGRIARSLRHDGTTDDINTSALFDPYKKYVDEKAMAAGAVVIDSDLDTSSTNPVQNKIVAGAIAGLNGRLDQIEQGGTGGADVPTEVRQALYRLLNNNAFSSSAGFASDVAVLQSWATEVTDITISQSAISISGAATSQLTATTSPAGGLVTWSTSNSAVATVSSTGLVTGVGNGTAKITASCGGKKAVCTVTVSGFATLTGITAVYSGGSVYDTATLNDLKSDLVVTANYSDSTTRTLSDSDYTLSGTLEVGTSTITVAYGSQTDTFNVTVTVAHKVNATLMNLTSSNTSSVVGDGESYSARLSTAPTYIVVTMGGTDITATAVSNDEISIPSVTDNINIFAYTKTSATVSGYTFYDYLAGVRTAVYLNTEDLYNPSFGALSCDFIFYDTHLTSNAVCLMGARTTDDNTSESAGQFGFYDANGALFKMAFNGTQSEIGNIISNAINSVSYDYSNSNTEESAITFNGVTSLVPSFASSDITVNNSAPLTLFAMNNKGNMATSNSYGTRIGEVRFRNGSTLVHDYIPAFEASTNLYGMYDLVDGEFIKLWRGASGSTCGTAGDF